MSFVIEEIIQKDKFLEITMTENNRVNCFLRFFPKKKKKEKRNLPKVSRLYGQIIWAIMIKKICIICLLNSRTKLYIIK